MSEFKEDDRVIMLDTTQYPEQPSNPRCIEGTIKHIYDNGRTASVYWDNGENNGGYKNTDIGLVSNTITSSPMEESIDSLILLEEVEGAHKRESANWFQDMLAILSPVLFAEWPAIFNEYEELYKKKTDTTTMPITYRTAKSVIINGYNADISGMWDGMGKSAIEKATKEARSKEKVVTPEELLGTIIKACDTIKDAYNKLDTGTNEQVDAFVYIEATIGTK